MRRVIWMAWAAANSIPTAMVMTLRVGSRGARGRPGAAVGGPTSRQGSLASWRRSRGWLPFAVSTQCAPRSCRSRRGRVVWEGVGGDHQPVGSSRPASVDQRGEHGDVGSTTRRGARSSAGPFPRGLPPNPPYEFPRNGLSSDYSVSGVAGRAAWMVSWQGRQTMSVFRRLVVMISIHSARLTGPVRVRSASLRI